MLNKDQNKRPQVLQILQIPFVKKHIEMFIESNGKVNINPKLSVKKDIQPEVVQKMNDKDISEMTPAEKQKLKKEQKALHEFELHRKAARAAHLSSTRAKEMEQQQFHSGTQKTNIVTNSQRQYAQAMGTVKQLDQGNIGTMAASESTMSDFDANNRTMGDATHGRTAMRRDLEPNMEGKFPTEYDKPWISRQSQQ